MLNGVTKLNLDSKGRLAIPSRYRDYLINECAGRLVITMNNEQRLIIYPVSEWEIVEKKLSALSDFKKAEVYIKRLYLGHAEKSDMDKNGRITITPFLRNKANLEKEIVLMGVGNKFEIWDQASWTDEWESDELELEITESLEELSL